jgi:hypothetical protein
MTRIGQDMVGLRRPAVGPSHDLVAGREPGDSRPRFDDPAGEIAALAGREGGREHRFHRAVADSDLAWIDAGGGDLDEDLPLARRRPRDLGDVKDVDRAVPAELHPAAYAGSPGAGGDPLVSAAALPAAAGSIIRMAVTATIR